LFSGSLSWSKAFAELLDWQCISVDNDKKYTETTIICDILQWDVPERLHGSVGVVTKMSLISRIDALPTRTNVLCCGTFAFGYTEKPEEPGPGDPLALRVSADVYRYSIPYWFLEVWNSNDPWNLGIVFGDWEEVGAFGREEDARSAFTEHAGDKVWRGGLIYP